jgi:hypothetical protein
LHFSRHALLKAFRTTAVGSAGSQIESPYVGPTASKGDIRSQRQVLDMDTFGTVTSSVDTLGDELFEPLKEPIEDVSSPEAVEAMSS